MSEEKKEGAEKKCGNCDQDIICVKISKEWNNKTETKLQWQTKSTKKAHFKFAGEKDGKTIFNCIIPGEATEAPKPEAKPERKEVDIKVKVAGPFDEAELMARWASDKAYKMVMAGIENANNLSPQEKSGLGQKEGMLTRLLVDTVLELRKQNGMKSEYAK